MKILLCSPKNTGGGICRWTENILNFYNTQECDIDIKQFYGDKPTSQNIGRSILGRITNGIKTYYPIYKGIKILFKESKYDVIHICTSASVSLVKDYFIIKLAKKNNVRSVIHFHFGRIPDLFERKGWEYKLICKIIKMADKAVVIDKKSYDTLLNAGYKNIVNLPNPLTSVVENIINKNCDIQRINRKIVFAGHVIPTKGVFELVSVCKEIKDVKLYILGHVSSEMKSELENMVGDAKWLIIKGEQSLETTIKEMMSCNVFVLPTYTEGFPNVIIESMSCGCPIVTTDVGAIPEMLDIKNGLNYGICVKPKDVEGLKEAINKMLSDKDYAKSCGIRAKQRVHEQYSMNSVWIKLTDIWKSV